MKTVEQAAEEHANECVHNPNPNDYPDVSSGDIWEYIKDAFKAGVEFAQKWIPPECEYRTPEEVIHELELKSAIGNPKYKTDGNKKNNQSERGLKENNGQGKRFEDIGIGKGAGGKETSENRQN